jgi:hypothetical protein
VKANIILSMLVLSLLALSLYYRGEGIETELACQQTLKTLSDQSEANRIADEVKNNAIETKRVKDEQIASERSRGHVKRLRSPQPVVQDIVNNCACNMPDDVGRVLREASDDPRLSKASDPALPPSAAETTPDDGQ